MNPKDTLSLLTKNTNLYRSYSQLSRGNQLRTGWEVLRLQAQIIFSRKLAWFIGGILTYFTTAYIINYRQPVIDRLDQDDVLAILLIMPLCVLAVYLNMQLISSEKDNRTLEVLFTTAGSRHKVWLLRLGTLNLLLLLIAFGLSNLAFFTITDIPIFGMAIHGFVPAFLVGNLTLYFSVRFRSGFAAAMVVAILIVLSLMLSDAFDIEDTRYFLFFNPYHIPRELDPETWYIWTWHNRLGMVTIAALLQFFSLRGLEARERLLR